MTKWQRKEYRNKENQKVIELRLVTGEIVKLIGDKIRVEKFKLEIPLEPLNLVKREKITATLKTLRLVKEDKEGIPIKSLSVAKRKRQKK